MTSLRSTLTLACLVLLGAAAGAQTAAQRAAPAPSRGGGITDIMRRAAQPAAALAPRPVPSPAAAAAARPPAGQRAAEYIVALVNSEPITNSEVQSRLARVLESNPEVAERAPRAELARQVLERIIAERAQLQVAKESNIKVDDLAIDQAEQIVARQNQITVDEVRRRIAADGISLKEFRNDLRNQLLLARVREREIEPKVKVSDLEVDQYLRDQRASAATAAPQDINVAQVLIAVPENASPTQLRTLEQKAQAIAQRARGGEDFAKLVRENTDLPDRDNGGALGLRNIDRYPPLFVDAIQSTPVGGVAGPVRSGAGFHVLKVLAKQRAGASDAAVTQTQVRHILLRTDAKRSAEQAAAQLLDFKRRIQGGTADFAGLARDNSQDGSAKEGGDLGWRQAGDFVPEFEEAVNRLTPGQISEPVVTRFGVHLIQLVGRREAKLNEAEQREAARSALREKRLDEAYETWAQEVRSRAYVEYRESPQS